MNKIGTEDQLNIYLQQVPKTWMTENVGKSLHISPVWYMLLCLKILVFFSKAIINDIHLRLEINSVNQKASVLLLC
jgi:quinol-cytochrome oxidoreductase complex cytochrome b subunit